MIPFSLQLPVTMLYDYQSVAAVVEYINDALTAGAELAAADGGDDAAPAGADLASDSDVEDITASASAQRQTRSRAAKEAAAEAAADRPSELLKTLRAPPAQRPLFLAAPGVANAQSAYFSFSQFLQASTFYARTALPDAALPCLATPVSPGMHACMHSCGPLCYLTISNSPLHCVLPSLSLPSAPCLQWSSQPIYVLDKDNDLTVTQLALRNAVDMVRVQPEGPYLVGGHSYGGAGEKG